MYSLKQAKKNNQAQPIFFLGAGASTTGAIPLAGQIVKKILEDYADNPFIKDLPEDERTYAKLMDCLLPAERDELLKGYIKEAKINVTHIYLAQLLNEGYADYVLTVNFDNLMLRALALYNIFPATYDMAILKDLTTTTFKEKSVVYLHGQNHGLWLLNTPEEMAKVKSVVLRIFDSIKNGRPWVFIGYSGDDPIFNHIKNLGRFDNGLYWISYNDHNPSEKVMRFLSDPNTNAFLIKGYDSDSFMLKLNSELGLQQPAIVDKPFTAIKEMLNAIVDVDDKEHFKGVKKRLEISKRQVDEAIQQYEYGKVEAMEGVKGNAEADLLKKEIINTIVGGNYDEELIADFEIKAQGIADENLQSVLSDLYMNWASDLSNLAKKEKGAAADILFNKVFNKYKRAIEINPSNYYAYNNWGSDIISLARIKQGKEREDLCLEACEKFKACVEVNDECRSVYSNWGSGLSLIADVKKGKESEDLHMESIKMYKKALEINPEDFDALYNWGNSLIALAKMKSGKAAKEMIHQAFEKCQQAYQLGSDSYNLACCYALMKNRREALLYLEMSLNDNEVDISFVKEDSDWEEYLMDEDFILILEKYKTKE